MSLRICSLASGSSGNCYVVGTEDTVLLVDAGLSGKQIKERLADLDQDINNVNAVLITHEHSDHIKGLSALSKLNRLIFASEKTFEALNLELDSDLCQSFNPGEQFEIGDILVSTFKTSHDAADPVGYCFESEGKAICIVTDTGYVSEEIKSFISKADILVLEANHDENVLKMGRYPWFLKQRILSDEGHLSNEAAATALAEVMLAENPCKQRQVLLAHLSKENNFPEMAQATLENILRERGCSPKNCTLHILSRNEVSKIYE